MAKVDDRFPVLKAQTQKQESLNLTRCGMRDGYEIDKGVVLTEDYLKSNYYHLGNIIGIFTAYPDLYLDVISPTDDDFDLFFYQRIALRAIMRYTDVYITAPRAWSKSFIIILGMLLQCIFMPGTKRFICAPNKNQSAQIAKEKLAEIFRHWPLLRKEIVGGDTEEMPGNYGKDYVTLKFKNGSILDVVGALDSQRGERRHGGLIDEIRKICIKKNIVVDENSYLLLEVISMKCYIYFIINKVSGDRYVGQTTNFSRRKTEHLSKLKNNIHPNVKLQNAYNKYGEDNFYIEKITYDNLTKEELDKQEIYFIDLYHSYENGYNLTRGGTGGDCRSKLTFEQYAFAYSGNTKYSGMSNRTANYLGVDSHCISSLAKGESYDVFRERYEKLSEEEKSQYLKEFENIMDIENNPPWVQRKTPEDELALNILCVVSTYKRGIESAVLKCFNLSKGFVFHLITGNGRENIKKEYYNMSVEERQNKGRQFLMNIIYNLIQKLN